MTRSPTTTEETAWSAHGRVGLGSTTTNRSPRMVGVTTLKQTVVGPLAVIAQFVKPSPLDSLPNTRSGSDRDMSLAANQTVGPRHRWARPSPNRPSPAKRPRMRRWLPTFQRRLRCPKSDQGLAPNGGDFAPITETAQEHPHWVLEPRCILETSASPR